MVLEFLAQYKYIIGFYIAIIIFLILGRKRVSTQAKIIILYRTKIGIKLMDKISGRYREWVKLWGYVGIGAGFAGLIIISYFLIQNLFSIFTNPEAASGVALVLPGVNIPGLGVLPFWFWLISIFLVALIHEFSHGVVARAHNVPVQNTGLVFLGPIIGAFVEPDEKKMVKQTDIVQYSVYAAGAWSNILMGLAALLLLAYVFTPLQGMFVEPTGFSFATYADDGSPAAISGLPEGSTITMVDGKTIQRFEDAQLDILCKAPGDTISLTAENETYTATLATHPEIPDRGYLGIIGIQNEAQQINGNPILYAIITWFKDLFFWLSILSIGIGLFNLLPLPIVDGGRMMQTALQKVYGKEKGDSRYAAVGLFFLALLILNLIAPALLRFF